jgi:hypothetical protein
VPVKQWRLVFCIGLGGKAAGDEDIGAETSSINPKVTVEPVP